MSDGRRVRGWATFRRSLISVTHARPPAPRARRRRICGIHFTVKGLIREENGTFQSMAQTVVPPPVTREMLSDSNSQADHTGLNARPDLVVLFVNSNTQ